MNKPDWTRPIDVELFNLYNFNLYTAWSQQTVGFGELSITVTPAGDTVTITGETERMGREWVRKCLHAVVDKIADAIPDTKNPFPVEVPIPKKILEHRATLRRMIDEP